MERPRQTEMKTDLQRTVLKRYYLESDYFSTPEGILKIISIIICTITSISFLWAGWCSGGGAAGVTSLLAVASLALCACAVYSLAEYAPMTCFFIELVLYTMVGVSLFVIAVLSVTLCDMRRPIDYVYGPLALINSVLVISSAITTYVTVAKLWDLEIGSINSTPRQESINELEV